MADLDWTRIAPDIAKQLLGEPSSSSSKELRYGKKGSLCINLESATWFDFETSEGGGIIDLIKHLNQDVDTVLKQYGFGQPLGSSPNSLSGNTPIAKPSGRSFTRDQLVGLYKEAIVKMKYSDDFIVLRFPDGHHIKQKYAPFHKINDTWYMKRPEGLMPLHITDEHLEQAVLVSEGEKACNGSKNIYKYDTATWHGGVNSWDKTDWSPIFGRDVIIWSDNDEPGITVANKIAEFLRTKNCNVKIPTIPENFQEKDDLHDAVVNNYFGDPQAFQDYLDKSEEAKVKGSLTFTRADEVLKQVSNPEWLIKDCIEQRSLIQVYGSPKSGKSFVAIAMSCAIASGNDFYGLESSKKPVLYICGEGQRGVKRRLAAWQQAQYDLTGVPLFLSDRAVRIGDKDDFERLKKEIEAVMAVEGEISMLVIDTFQRCFAGGGGNENSAEDVGNFVAQLDTLIAEYGCSVCLVHHSGHQGGRARGSSVIGASLDYEFKVERTDKGEDMYVSFQQTLNKDGQGMSAKKFVFKEVELIGQGLELTSGFLEETTVDFKAKNDITYKQKLVLEALERESIFADKSNPQDHFFYAKDLKNKVADKDGNIMSVESIKKILYRLVDLNFVKYFEDVGYQSMEYSKLAPKFD